MWTLSIVISAAGALVVAPPTPGLADAEELFQEMVGRSSDEPSLFDELRSVEAKGIPSPEQEALEIIPASAKPKNDEPPAPAAKPERADRDVARPPSPEVASNPRGMESPTPPPADPNGPRAISVVAPPGPEVSLTPGVAPIVLWAVGAAGLTAGTVLTVQAQQHHRRVMASMPGSQIDARLAKDESIAGSISLVAGATSAGLGFLVWLLGIKGQYNEVAVIPLGPSNTAGLSLRMEL